MQGISIALLSGIVGVCALACTSKEPVAEPKEESAATKERTEVAKPKGVNPRLLRRFKPVREMIEREDSDHQVTEASTNLGRMLYYEKRLSSNHDLSCNSCHNLNTYGVDNKARSPGHRGRLSARNSPTVYHAAGYVNQFWDGRAVDVEEQALVPILADVEMAAPSREHVIAVLKSIPEYSKRFKAAFPDDVDPVTFTNIGKAIGAFERKLTTPARWDDYLRGQKDALSPLEIEGLRSFTNLGCMVCHTGEFLGGATNEKVGVVEPWPNQEDQGIFVITKRPADKMKFKVPTLRNVEKTAPYFHDGSANDLKKAVAMMGKHQLGLELSQAEIRGIVAWLKSLTGQIPKAYIAKPELPLSTEDTPKPIAM